jgi:catechol 2,3-dioxygenase-like lactoylglutathione lyase family enzyme
MSRKPSTKERATGVPSTGMVDMKLEVIVLPVADVERAKQFYAGLGWRVDGEFEKPDGGRLLQMTPPGSPCSIHFGTGLTEAAPGSAQGMYLVVDDLEAACAELKSHGADVSEPFHYDAIGGPRVPGRDTNNHPYNAYATFSDPDGNTWLLQEVKVRLPGRGMSVDVPSMTALLREAEANHGNYEKVAPKHHWSDWYAAFMVARVRGRSVGEAANDAGVHMKALPPMKRAS